LNVLNLDFRKQKMMRTVMLSLIPIIIFSVYNYGLRVLALLTVITITGTAVEYLWEKHYNNKPSEAIFVTCILYTMTLPSSIPYWIAVIGIIFGVILARCLLEGLAEMFLILLWLGGLLFILTFQIP